MLNLIDTPGHVDFTVEVERSLRVLDGAVTVLDGQMGVEPQTETVWRQAVKYSVPRIIFVNKMDKIGANFFNSLKSISEKLGVKSHAIQLPIGSENDFVGIIDLIKMKAYIYEQNDQAENCKIVDVPAQYLEEASRLRAALVEEVVSFDDSLMEAFFEGKEISEEQIKHCIRKGVLTANFFPVLCGSAFKHKGIKLLLDAVVDYLPSPADIGAVQAQKNDQPITIPCSDQSPFVALAFKIVSDPFIGRLTLIRVYSGVLKAGSYVINSTKQKKERVSRLVRMHANQRAEIKEIYAGDICGVVGLRETATGDTIVSEELSDVRLEKINFAEPVISLAIEPKTKADQEKMGLSLQKLTEEDPTFRTHTDQETGQTIIEGMGELHLDVIVDRLRREFKVDVNVGAPQVSYRETFADEVESEGKYIKQSGGRGQYGHVVIKFSPNRGKGFEFVDAIVGGKIPKEYIKSVKSGLEEALTSGPLAGYPMMDIKAVLFDGSFHEVDSSELAFKIAASLCLKEAAKKSSPILLEPIVKVEVTVPGDYFGDTMGDISSRRGSIEGTEQRGNLQNIKAKVPLREMFGYATDLRSFTQGRGSYVLEFSHYSEVPKSITKEILSANEKK